MAKKLKYNLAETFEPTNDKLTPMTKCIWSYEDQAVVWGYGMTKAEARMSALEVAQRHGLLHRPAK